MPKKFLRDGLPKIPTSHSFPYWDLHKVLKTLPFKSIRSIFPKLLSGDGGMFLLFPLLTYGQQCLDGTRVYLHQCAIIGCFSLPLIETLTVKTLTYIDFHILSCMLIVHCLFAVSMLWWLFLLLYIPVKYLNKIYDRGWKNIVGRDAVDSSAITMFNVACWRAFLWVAPSQWSLQ